MTTRLPIPGGDAGEWGEILNTYLKVAHKPDGTLKIADVVASKYTVPAGGIPMADLHQDVQTAIETVVGGMAPDATTTSRGVVRLSGDLTGDALSPLVAPGRINGGSGGQIATGTITDGNIHANAAIAKAKLAPLAITNDDIAVGAAIVQSKIQGLTAALADKASLAHAHSAASITSGSLDIARIPTGTTGTTVALGNHGHTIANITGLQTSLNAKANTTDLANYIDDTALQSALAGKQDAGDYATNSALNSGLAGKANVSDIADFVTEMELNDTLVTKQDVGDYATNSALTAGLAGKANTSDLANYIDDTALQSALAGKQDSGDYATNTALNNGLSSKQDAGDYATNSALTSGLATKANTSDLADYATNTALSNGLATKQDAGDYATSTALTSGLASKANTSHTHTSSQVSDFISAVAAVLGDRIVAGSNVTVDYDSGNGTVTINSAGGGSGEPSELVLTVAGRTGDVVLVAGDITAGTFAPARIPNLNADKVTSGTFDIARLPTGNSNSTVALGDHDHDGQYAALGHGHTIANITGLQDELAAKVETTGLADYATNIALGNGLATKQDAGDYATNTALSNGLATKQDAGDYATNAALTSGLAGKANTADLENYVDDSALQSALATKQDAGDYATNTALSNGLATKQDAGDYATNTALNSGLADKADAADLDNYATNNALASGLAGKADVGHAHSAGEITSGTFDIGLIPTGTSSSTVALGNHNHVGDYAALDHNHDSLYYTETEVDNFLASKLDASEKGAVNGIARLDAEGKILASELPALAVKETYTVGSQAAMLALIAQKGDMAVRTDNSQTYVLAGDNPSTIGDWVALTTGVTGVTDHGALSGLTDDDHPHYHNTARADAWLTGKTTDDITEGTNNLYISTAERTTLDNLADVATSGSYDDLVNTPTIPAAQVNADWDASSGVAEILNKPTLGTAASADAGNFATAAQGSLAASAVQPAAIADFETTTQLNSRDTANRNRANHTGTQAIATVDGLQTELDGKVSSTTVATIWTGTQTAYEAMPSHDPDTLYLITGA